MKRTKRLLAMLTALVMVMGMLPITALAAAPIALEMDTRISVAATWDEPAVLTFTPAESGKYVLVSSNGHDPQASLYLASDTERQNKLMYADDQNDMEFRLAYYLTAGTDYVYEVDNRDSMDPFYVELMRGVELTGFAIDGVVDGELTLPITHQDYRFDIEVFPANADALLTVTVEDDAMVYANVYDGTLELELLWTGSTTLTITDGGVSQTITVNVVEPTNVLQVGTTEVAEATHGVTAYSFTAPESGLYKFVWTDAEESSYGSLYVDTLSEYGEVYGVNSALGHVGDTLSMFASLEAGKPYIVSLQSDDRSVSGTLTVGKAVTATGLSFAEGEELRFVYDEEMGGISLTPVFEPMLAMPEEVVFASSDNAVATVDEYGEVTFLGYGHTQITATSTSGLTATFDLYLEEPAPFLLGETYSFTADLIVTEQRYIFTPAEKGNYLFTLEKSNPEEYMECVVVHEDGRYDGLVPGTTAVSVKAGERCTIVLRTTPGITLTLSAEKAIDPTGVEWETDAVEIMSTDSQWLSYTLLPEGAYDFAEVTVADETIGMIPAGDETSVLLVGVNPGTTTVTVTTTNGHSDTMTVTVTPPPMWPVGKAETVIITPIDSTHSYGLTVKEDGWYEFFSEGEFNPAFDLYDNSMMPIAWGDDEDGKNFRKKVKLNADELYFFDIYSEELLAQFAVTVRPCEAPSEDEDPAPPTGGDIVQKESITVSVGDLFYVDYSLGEDDYLQEITFSDASVVSEDYLRGSDGFLAMAPGTVTITYKTMKGYIDTLTVTVEAARTIALGEEVQVELAEDVFGRGYAFVPSASGDYVFYNRCDEDAYLYLLDSAGDVVDSSDDGPVGYDSLLESTLTAGETYYVIFMLYAYDADVNVKDYVGGVETPAEAESIEIVPQRGYLFVRDDVYYVVVDEEVDYRVKVTPTYAAGECTYEFEGVLPFYEYPGECIFEEVGNSTLTVTMGEQTATLRLCVVEAVAGDLNFDGEVDKTDVGLLRAYLGGDETLGLTALLANMDGNGVIDNEDLALLREEVGDAMLGDVDGNGKIDSTDARLILQYAVGKIKDTDLDLAVADVSGDKKFDSTDARLILQYAVNKIDKFPAAK